MNESQEVLMEKGQKIIDFFNNSYKVLDYLSDHLVLKNNAGNFVGVEVLNNDKPKKQITHTLNNSKLDKTGKKHKKHKKQKKEKNVVNVTSR